MVTRFFMALVIGLMMALPGTAQAQGTSWIQIEALPTLQEAQERARSYDTAFANLSGFRLRSGWYALTLGPFARAEAERELNVLLRERLVPGDSFVAEASDLGPRFWPVGNQQTAPQQQAQAQVQAAPVVTTLPDETPAQARRSEAALSRDEKMLLQEALKWEGHYTAAIDGAFGPGTRGSMRAYQETILAEPTGVLTTRQRARLLEGYRDALAALGMRTVDEVSAGIRIDIPAGMVEFARYEAPFVHYDSTTEDNVRVLLISQHGDQNTLFGLYDIMQTLEIVPLNGDRERGRTSFTLTGQNADLHSYTYAALKDDMIKGFTLIWKPENERLMTKVVSLMQDSFEPYGDVALDDASGAGDIVQSRDLLSGLDIRRPELTRTGFYVDGSGRVLTTLEAVGTCQRVTLADEYDADVAARDEVLGLALLQPRNALSPLAYAAFKTGQPRLMSEIAVAGFPYGDALDLPVMTYGTLEDVKGLQGEADVNRLAVETLPGDAGGPVLDGSGAVLGMLLPSGSGQRQLPPGVNFAANLTAIGDFLTGQGVEMAASSALGTLDPVDLSALASDMTVQVSCWN